MRPSARNRTFFPERKKYAAEKILMGFYLLYFWGNYFLAEKNACNMGKGSLKRRTDDNVAMERCC